MGEIAQLFDRPDVAPRLDPEALRIAEALVFVAAEPLDEAAIASRLPEGADIAAIMAELQRFYADRGIQLVRVARKWAFRTAVDLSWLLARDDLEPRKLSRAAIETLAIIAYHQPVTRADIEEVRGVAVSKGALDVLMEAGWVRMRGRRRSPGARSPTEPVRRSSSISASTSIGDLPGLDELKGAGLFDGKLPSGFGVPLPSDAPGLADDEEPLEAAGDSQEIWGTPGEEEGA